MDTLGSKIKEMRKKSNLKQNEIAALVGIVPSYLSEIENENRQPSLETTKKLAAALNTSVAYLIAETDDPEPSSSLKALTLGEVLSLLQQDPDTSNELINKLKKEFWDANKASKYTPEKIAEFLEEVKKAQQLQEDRGDFIHETIRETFIEKPNVPESNAYTETPRNERGETMENAPGSTIFEYQEGANRKIKLTFPPGMSSEEMEAIISRSIRATLGGIVHEQDLEPQKEKTGDHASPVAVVI